MMIIMTRFCLSVGTGGGWLSPQWAMVEKLFGFVWEWVGRFSYDGYAKYFFAGLCLLLATDIIGLLVGVT